MASSSRTEAVARLGELVLIDGSQYLVYGLLHQTVYYCRYSQQAHLAIVLGDFYPFDGVRTVRTSIKERMSASLLADSHENNCSHDILSIPPQPLLPITAL